MEDSSEDDDWIMKGFKTTYEEECESPEFKRIDKTMDSKHESPYLERVVIEDSSDDSSESLDFEKINKERALKEDEKKIERRRKILERRENQVIVREHIEPNMELVRKIKDAIDHISEQTENLCPGCLRLGFDKKEMQKCELCESLTCTECSYEHPKLGHICYIHSVNKGEKVGMSLERKIIMYQEKDLYQFGYEGDIDLDFIYEQLEKQKGVCYICGDFVLLNHPMNCCYQISIDRLSNYQGHFKSSCVIACNYCNSRTYYRKVHCKDLMKVCKANCHIVQREVPRKKEIIHQLTGKKVGGYEFW